MPTDRPHADIDARARLAGFLFLAVNATYVASLVTTAGGSDDIRRVGVAFQTAASAATILMAWSFYELLRPTHRGLALVALLFRVAEAALFGVFAIFSLVELDLGGADRLATADQAVMALTGGARNASGHVAQVYFCAGSLIFFFLLMRSRIIPRSVAAFGLAATGFSLLSSLLQIGAPAYSGYLSLSGLALLAAEAVAGMWLLIAGAGHTRRVSRPAAPAPA